MALEQLAISARRSRETVARQPRHDLAQDRGMILGLGLAGSPFDAELLQIRAQPRQRPLVQKTGEIVGPIGQKLAAPDADEEIEIFALDALDLAAAGGVRERGMRRSDRARIAAQAGEALEQAGIGGAREQSRQQRVFLRARGIDLVDIAAKSRMLAVKVGAQNRATHAGRVFDRDDALGGNARPVRHRRLRNAYFSRERTDSAGSADRFVETSIPHGRFFLLIWNG